MSKKKKPHPPSVDVVLSKVRNLIEKIDSSDSESEKTLPSEDSIFFVVQGRWVALSEDAADQYKECLRLIYALMSPKQAISEKRVQKMLHEAIFEGVDFGDGRAASVQAAIAKLRESIAEPAVPWRVFISIRGMAPPKRWERFGLLRFQFANEGFMRYWRKKTRPILSARVPDKKERRIQEKSFSRWVDDIRDKVLAVAVVDAVDAEKAREKARVEVRRTLDIMNFFAGRAYPKGNRAFVFLAGERDSTTEHGLLLKGDPPTQFTISPSRAGQLIDVSLSRMKEFKPLAKAMVKSSKLLSSSNPSEMDERLLAACQLVGRAATEPRREEAFLLYIIAIEGLILGPQERTEVSYRFRMHAATLLGKNLEHRALISRVLDGLYSIRSSIVHNGYAEIDDYNFRQAKYCAERAVLKMLTERPFTAMRSFDELRAWFQRRLFA